MKKLVLAILVLFSVSAFAGHAPLPPELMQAKTVYIQNDGAPTSDLRVCTEELNKWGRFTVVSNPKDADVIFRLNFRIENGGYRVTSYGVSSTMNALKTITVSQRSTGNILWTDTRAAKLFGSPTKAVVNELRKRVEEQELMLQPC